MNKFTGVQSLQDAFKSIADTILINDVPQQAYITTAHLGEKSRRHLHSIEPFNQGDYVDFREGVYMVVEDVINQRGAKYKSTIEHCNYKITLEGESERVITGYDDRGRPIYGYITKPGREIHAIVDMDRVTISGAQIRINTSMMSMLVPDTEENRTEIIIGKEYDVYGSNMAVSHINRLRTGLLEINLQVKVV
ncbi:MULTISPECIES: hypothetical protein [unclassified Sporosarcina]|uniref:hypothetical protein n=1 Tax=unclassified Sporosarcina TaxID=2647733 RepID=UPI00203C5121|nr:MULTISPECIES: hypothetical protein [unclassified Sporosarcina]GKV65593.1 hypothetical protein NCCP2331_17460 [Sporosarcina sp. NCCP-2331]GLB55827.1 hypothetical protein NCCP2378_16140 [Sporosarcina sp. NCCP-2378]